MTYYFPIHNKHVFMFAGILSSFYDITVYFYFSIVLSFFLLTCKSF